ncbi:D-3-phosphoglycerate dehydrogenase [Peribacillus deserti]|uniref:D-3-phosphoglycerate dehydrogenase n=1 Tax=Peribacillus deserti TaxID=673318 RepID=A0ABS2QR72_9BACI|nr:phosphoglycerate dehydrogenase [Peribacillus deserti]MBM7694736.1 D-3-phosphoglycerate dehydrogenase [Peribacillus deserti]
MFRVLVADAIKPEGLGPLLDAPNIELLQQTVTEAGEILESIDALLVRSETKVTDELLSAMPNIKIVARAGVGIDNIDVASATKHGVVVVNAPDGNTISTAEHTFAMMASLARNIPQAHSSLKQKEWKRAKFIGTELYGKNLGIVGMGRIGGEIAKRAKAFGMDVYVYDPFFSAERAKSLNVKAVPLEELMKSADFITVHTPLTKETKGLINETNLKICKKGVYLLNCARGGIIDEDALYQAIMEKHVAGAAFDVFVEEPPFGNKLLELDEIIVTPHLGASTKEAQLNVATQVAQEVLQYLNGNPVSNSINLPAISKEVFNKIQPYYLLVKQMGALASQLTKRAVLELSVTYAGIPDDFEKNLLTKALAAGFFKRMVDTPVNEVNALLVAKERGVTIGEKVSEKTYGYANSISLTVKAENRIFEIRGSYIDQYGPRILNLNGFNIDFQPQGNLLYIQHTDKPGVIGRVGKVLGDHDVNIATMQVGRKQAGGEAIMILTFDKPLSENIIDQLESSEDISFLHHIVL